MRETHSEPILESQTNSNEKQTGTGHSTAALAPPGYGIDFLDSQRLAASAGLPGHLKTGVERLSGLSLSDVRVHYNSPKPQQLQALAYAHGSDIHLGPGQEKHLAHEAWHVVQQKQGLSPTTLQMKGGPASGDQKLEAEADKQGAQAAQQAAQPDAVHADPASNRNDGLAASVKENIINGRYANNGQYTVSSSSKTVKKTVETWRLGKKVKNEVENTETSIDSIFVNKDLQQAKEYLDKHWAPSIDIGKSTGGSGDTKGKHIEMPNWVYDYQNKLAAQKPRDYQAKSWEKNSNPAWNQDSFLAQRILEAFLREWHRKELPDLKAIPSNLEELYKRGGVSEKAYGNAQAQLLGDPNVFGWCGPASYNAVVLGLFRNGLRFKTGKALMTAALIEKQNKQQASFIKNSIKWKNKNLSEDELQSQYQAELSRMAFMAEINAQAAFFIANDTSKSKGWLKTGRFVSGDMAYAKYDLKPGDIITQALMNGSPVSGHVLTVVKEERNADFKGVPGTAVSTVYGISGNAGSIGGGSVKIEKFTREMPPENLKSDLNAMSSLGNRMTVAVDARKQTENAERARLAKEQSVAPHKVAQQDIAKAADAKQIENKTALQAELKVLEEDFRSKTGMSYDDFLKAKTTPNPTQRPLITSIGRLRLKIRSINDFTAVPMEAAAKKIPYAPSSPYYSDSTASGAGKFRPNAAGSMWITTIIKAAEFADAHKINAELNLDGEAREKKLKEMGLDPNMTAEKFKEKIYDKYGMEALPGPVATLWPGAIEAIEGQGLAKDYG